MILLALVSALAPALVQDAGTPGTSPNARGLVERGVVVLARDADGFGLVDSWPDGRTAPMIVPFTSRSELVRRATPDARGVALRLVARGTTAVDRVVLEAVEHASDEQVLRDGEVVFIVGPPTLPRLSDPDLLPLVARQDAAYVGGGTTLSLEPPDGAPARALVALGWRDAEVSWRRRSESEATRQPVPSGAGRAAFLPQDVVSLDVVERADAGLDRLFHASVRPVASDPRVACRLVSASSVRSKGLAADGVGAVDPATLRERDGRGPPAGDLTLWFVPPPDVAPGRTWTLLLALDLCAADPAEARDRPRPRPALTPVLGAEEAHGYDRDWEPHDVLTASRDGGPPFAHLEGPDEQLDIRPTMGPGAAWGDVDGDGAMDLYLVQGGGRDEAPPPRNRLLRNRTPGPAPGRAHPDTSPAFEDITDASGTGDTGRGMGALFFDVEGDADVDLYVANRGADVLYLGDGAGVFADASGDAGVGGDLWSAGIAAGDTDLDGDLDVYVTSYLDYDPARMPPAEELGRYRREDPIEMLPFAFPGQHNTFLRNDTWRRTGGSAGEVARGAVRFTDVTEELGLLDAQGRGMQPVFWDFDRDGDLDLYVANDVSYNVLYRNEGDGTFKDVSFASGMDDPRGGMGVAVGDVDLDGDEDLFLTNWELEPNALYLNNLVSHTSRRSRVATFRDVIVSSGLGPAGIGVTSWGAELLDADNDGDLDLYVANGYTSPDYESTGICVGQPNHFFLNDGTGRFTRRPARRPSDPLLGVPELPSRCAAACDFDRDGDPDLVVTANNARAQLLVNRLGDRTGHHWLAVRLRGGGPNPYGIGAEVTVEAGGRLLRKSLRAGTSYLAGNPAELCFGLGADEAIDGIVVRWPSGRESRHAPDGVDRLVVLEEPE